MESSDGFHQLATPRTELKVWHHERNCICPQSYIVLYIGEGAVGTFYIHYVKLICGFSQVVSSHGDSIVLFFKKLSFCIQGCREIRHVRAQYTKILSYSLKNYNSYIMCFQG